MPAKGKGSRGPRKRKAELRSRGLRPAETGEDLPAPLRALAAAVEADGGRALAPYRDPLGGHGVLLAALPLEQVRPTPFQRDASPAHVQRLAAVLGQIGRFLDPVVAVREGEKDYWCPNGNHRLEALRALGARTVTALVLPDREIAFRILALNTEKAHNLREKSLEVVRMARALAAERPEEREDAFAPEFEEPGFLTLGACYEEDGRFAGGAYRWILRKVDAAFLREPLPAALRVREARAARLRELDAAVVVAVAALKERGFRSPYLRAAVVARINFLRFVKGDPPPFDAALDRLLRSAAKFDPGKIREGDLAAAAGPPDEEPG